MNCKRFCLLIFTVGWCHAQSEIPASPYKADSAGFARRMHDPNLMAADSALLIQKNTIPIGAKREIDSDLRKKYQGRAFDYSIIKPHESFLDRLKRKLSKLVDSFFGKIDVDETSFVRDLLIRLVSIVIIGLVLYFLIRFFAGKDGVMFWGKKNRRTNRITETVENIHEIDFPEKIATFERQKSYREAIRYQFLYILKKLSDQKKIEWIPEKTNHDYAGEIHDRALNRQYRQLSYIFENVWYGEFKIEAIAYEKFKKLFQDFAL